MRRAIPALLALAVFLPSAALARTQFVCGIDRVVRQACCCPPKKVPPPMAPAMKRECCTIEKHAPATPPPADAQSTQSDPTPLAVAVVVTAVTPAVRDVRIAIVPRAQAPPLERSLFSQHCALLV